MQLALNRIRQLSRGVRVISALAAVFFVGTAISLVTPPFAASVSAPKFAKSIRDVDLMAYIKTHLAEISPDMADLDTTCGEGQAAVLSIAPIQYGDLDGDGQEEAAFEGFSCLSGTGGADFWGVLKLVPNGKIKVLPIEEIPKTFKGRDVSAGLRGHLVLQIHNGYLHQVLPIYNEGNANCCPNGGERHFVFRWNNQKFALQDVFDVPDKE